MKYSDGKCLVCKSNMDENLEHLLFFCENSRQIWTRVQHLLRNVFGDKISITSLEATTGYWQTEINNDTLIMNLINSITRFHLWKVRNRVKYENERIQFSGNIRVLKYSLLQHISLLKSSESSNKPIIDIVYKLEREIRDKFIS